MARTSKSPAKRRPAPARKKRPIKRRPAATKPRRDPLDDFIVAAARALDLPAKRPWLPAIKANLRVTLQHANVVAEFRLPDDAEPAPVFRA